MLSFTTEQLSEILEEIANFEVELEEDPTLPTLGIKYLNSKVASCRKYLNRVSYYIQVIGRQLKDLRLQVNQYELDLEFKISMKLADDEIVRKQPSVEDRKALAIAMLRDEHEQLSTARMALMDTQETFKIIKMKHIPCWCESTFRSNWFFSNCCIYCTISHFWKTTTYPSSANPNCKTVGFC